MWSPVLICTLNRFNHFVACIESLKKCKGSNNTVLYVSLDFPIKESQIEGHLKISNYLDSINGFKKVIIVKREFNFGVNRNWREMQNLIFEQYDRLIISEDDNTFSIHFLEYMNFALNYYKDNENIFSITGYNYPLVKMDNYKFDSYLFQGFCGWGAGYWKHKFLKISDNKKFILTLLYDNNLCKLLQTKYKIYYFEIIKMLISNKITFDGLVLLYLIKNNYYSVYPSTSYVVNHGLDGSGVNGKKIENSKFISTINDQFIDSFKFSNNAQDSEIITQQIFDIYINSNIKLRHKLIKYIPHLYFKLIFKIFLNKNQN
jgi:hypothetical protein